MVKGFTIPTGDKSGELNFNMQDAFRGSIPTSINVLFTTAYYTNFLEDSELAGYRAHVQSVDKGSTVNMRTALKYDKASQNYIAASSDKNDNIMEFSVQFRMTLSQNVYQIRVIKLKSILEIMAEIMGFLAGMSFVARFSKQILLNNGVFKGYDDLIVNKDQFALSVRSSGSNMKQGGGGGFGSALNSPKIKS